MTSTVSFTVKEQDIVEHLVTVHGYSRVLESAKTANALLRRHERVHAEGLNQVIKHTHDM